MIQRRDHLRATRHRFAHSKSLWSLAPVGLFVGLIGCGGGGGDNNNNGTGTTNTATGTTGRQVATVNLGNTPGKVDFTFLTGAGRAAGDRTAVVRRVALTDLNGTVETRLEGERRLVLNRYSSQILDLNIPMLGRSSRQFTNLQFDVLRFETQDIDDQGQLQTTTFDTVVNLPVDLPASVRTFTGRTTHVPLYLDQDVIAVDSTTNRATFSLSSFQEINFRSGQENTVKGMLADYMAFDITGMSTGARPSLSNGNVATRVFFSGDGYALSDLDPYSGSAVNFEPLLPGGQQDVVIGRLAGPSQIPSSGSTPGGETAGTYSMVQTNPSSTVIPRTKITGLQGIWREHFRQRVNSAGTISNTGYLTNLHAFEMITIPSSEDNGRQDLIAVSQNIVTDANGAQRAVVTNCYFGFVDYEANRFFMYPIRNITSIIANPSGALQGQVSGTISATVNASGTATLSPTDVRFGSFSITSGGTPNGFPGSGDFVVLRR